jgi:hypothetical protein
MQQQKVKIKLDYKYGKKLDYKTYLLEVDAVCKN